MVSSIEPQSTGLREQLVLHLERFTPKQRAEIATVYDAPEEVEELANFLIGHPEEVLKAARREIESSLAWRLVEESVLEHDLGLYLDWAPVKHRRLMTRLGLLCPKRDESGQLWAVMPGALAAIFARRVTGQRGSLVVLLGRSSKELVKALAEEWGLSTSGSKVEQILRICDHFSREEMVQELLERLPNPDWIGDAMMVMELGGMCYWQQVYGYDIDEGSEKGEKVVPLMRRAERRQQREVAQNLTDLGVLFRLDVEGLEYPMVAVPEELWGGMWQLGRRWLMEWAAQSHEVLAQQGMGRQSSKTVTGLQSVSKWLLSEARGGRLSWDEEGITEKSREILTPIYKASGEPRWEDWWALGEEFRILEAGSSGEVDRGVEATTLLDLTRAEFLRETLREWCLGYSASEADAHLNEAVGLDDAWRRRAASLLYDSGDWVPLWMENEGVDPTSTGGGWLREAGTGPEEIVKFEAGVTTAFVLMTKLTWLDLLSTLEKDRYYPVQGLVSVLQCVAGLSMFSQLGLVLEHQPAAVYLPFQRASFLMDSRHEPRFEEWVREIIDRLFIPLGVAGYGEDKDSIWLETTSLRIEDPAGWPPEQRQTLMEEILGPDIGFVLPSERLSGLHQVAPVVSEDSNKVSVRLPLEEIEDIAAKRKVIGFDGQVIEFSANE